MRTVEEIVAELNLLPPQERLRLIEKVTVRRQEEETTEEARLAALDAFLALAGRAETNYTDVASNKYKDRETKPWPQRKPRKQGCHCEELEATKHSQDAGKDCFAALAMTPGR